MLFFSDAQSPKSINLQRSEQKGLKLEWAFHTTSWLQVGHLTVRVMAL